jgi:hypothetical protein
MVLVSVICLLMFSRFPGSITLQRRAVEHAATVDARKSEVTHAIADAGDTPSSVRNDDAASALCGHRRRAEAIPSDRRRRQRIDPTTRRDAAP